MQKKNINKILLAAVVLIWGVLIFNFSGFLLGKDATAAIEIPTSRSSNGFEKHRDAFVLTPLSRDPFLGTQKIAKKTSKPNLIKRPSKRVVSKPKQVVWPKIRYFGFVKSKESNASRLGLLRVDGKLVRIRKNQNIAENIKIVGIAQDSIGLQLGTVTKYFKQQ